MGRMLDALRQADSKRNGQDGPPAAVGAAEEDFVSDFANEEVPFIEVGPARSLEASAGVLAVTPPRLRIAPQPPPDAGPVLDGESPGLGVALRPLSASLVLPPPEERFSRDLIAFHQPDHPAAAEYRQLAAALVEGAAPESSRVLLCAGVGPGAGTTTVVLNLAVCLAGPAGRRVVVVDAGRPRPALADRLGLFGRPALAEVLDGRQSLDRALQPTGWDNLTALTAGQAELERPAAAEAWRPVLRLLRDRFDLVLIDAGSALPWFRIGCDGVYLVVPHAGADAPASIVQARALLKEGVPLRGCILTGR